MVTMEIPTTFHPQMEKISDSIGSTTGSSTTTIITQISNNHLTTLTSSSSYRIIINLNYFYTVCAFDKLTDIVLILHKLKYVRN